MFDKFIQALTLELGKELPGRGAQYRMAPAMRQNIDHSKEPGYSPKLSSVLLLFYPASEKIKLLLMLRPPYRGTHGGQVSFPGGKFEEEDITFERTALREAQEETGIDIAAVKMIGRLTDLYIPPSNFLVHPFAGYCKTRPAFRINPREVEQLIEPDLAELTGAAVHSKTVLQSSTGLKVDAPCYELQGHTVWGATAMILSELNEILKKIT